MNPLVRDILAILDAHPLVSSIKIVHLDETPTGRLEVKIRCRIANRLQFQVWIHQDASTLDYAYQLFTSVPLLDFIHLGSEGKGIGQADKKRPGNLYNVVVIG